MPPTLKAGRQFLAPVALLISACGSAPPAPESAGATAPTAEQIPAPPAPDSGAQTPAQSAIVRGTGLRYGGPAPPGDTTAQATPGGGEMQLSFVDTDIATV